MAEVFDYADYDAWMALRRQDVTASDVAAVAGVNPYKSALRVWGEKTGAIQPDAETNLMRRGRWLEPGILAAIQDIRPQWDIRKASVYLRDSDLRIGATPDFVAVDPERPGLGNVQGKVVAARSWRDRWGASENQSQMVPIEYQLQALTEAKLLGASWCAVAALVVGEFSADIHLLDVDLNDAAWDRIKDEVAFFWSCVDAGRQPPVDPRKDAETLRALFPRERDEAEPVDLSTLNHLPDLLIERQRLKADVKAIDTRLDEIDTELRATLKDAPAGTLPGWGITYRTESRNGYEVKPWSGRVLRVRALKERSSSGRARGSASPVMPDRF